MVTQNVQCILPSYERKIYLLMIALQIDRVKKKGVDHKLQPILDMLVSDGRQATTRNLCLANDLLE